MMSREDIEISDKDKEFLGKIAQAYSSPQVSRADSIRLIQEVERRDEAEHKSFFTFTKLAGVAMTMMLCFALIWDKPASQQVIPPEVDSELIWSTLMLEDEDFSDDFSTDADEEIFEEDVDELPEEYAALTMIFDAEAQEQVDFVE